MGIPGEGPGLCDRTTKGLSCAPSALLPCVFPAAAAAARPLPGTHSPHQAPSGQTLRWAPLGASVLRGRGAGRGNPTCAPGPCLARVCRPPQPQERLCPALRGGWEGPLAARPSLEPQVRPSASLQPLLPPSSPVTAAPLQVLRLPPDSGSARLSRVHEPQVGGATTEAHAACPGGRLTLVWIRALQGCRREGAPASSGSLRSEHSGM